MVLLQTKGNLGHKSHGDCGFKHGILRAYCLHLSNVTIYVPAGTQDVAFSRVSHTRLPSMVRWPWAYSPLMKVLFKNIFITGYALTVNR